MKDRTMIERIDLGSTPCDEECAQTVDDNYYERANKECAAFIRQLWRVLETDFSVTQDTAPDSFNLVVRTARHDFGDYYEVAIRFNDNVEEAVTLAYKLENAVPKKWDADARHELKL